uniref:BHLH domain-containing protein n=1 Tax=Callorhinchus milii TaxID=7868 RepID=A0A4W3I0R1_CALMI
SPAQLSHPESVASHLQEQDISSSCSAQACISTYTDWSTHSLSLALPGDCLTLSGRDGTDITSEPGLHEDLRHRSRWRCAGRQRQSASEREKLRMRGLATALHNLRMYLPPSVAAPDQSLTKLQTLRLTIRYIAHLTKLLGLSDRDELLGLSEGKSLHHHALPSLPTGHSLSHHRQDSECQWNFRPPERLFPILPQIHIEIIWI